MKTGVKLVQSATSPEGHKELTMKANIPKRETRDQTFSQLPCSTSIKSRCLKPTLMYARNNTKFAIIISRSSELYFLNSKP